MRSPASPLARVTRGDCGQRPAALRTRERTRGQDAAGRRGRMVCRMAEIIDLAGFLVGADSRAALCDTSQAPPPPPPTRRTGALETDGGGQGTTAWGSQGQAGEVCKVLEEISSPDHLPGMPASHSAGFPGFPFLRTVAMFLGPLGPPCHQTGAWRPAQALWG